MVLTDPIKKLEYDKHGWKDEWEQEWEKEANFRRSIFKTIQEYKHHYSNTTEYTPDGYKVWVCASYHLDPSLWAPFEGGLGWVKKTWDIRGSNWKSELENFKNKMLAALDEAWEKQKKTPTLDMWEAVESGNCALKGCGKPAKLRWKDRDRHSDKVYCSRDCAFEDMKIDYEPPKEFKNFDYICKWCHKQDKDVCQMEDGSYYHKSCFDKELGDTGFCVYCGKKNGSETWNWDNTKTGKYEKYCSHDCLEKASTEYCDYCGKQIEKYREGNKEFSGIYSVDSDGNQGTFCSEKCRKKGMKEKRFANKKNALSKLLNWMKKKGITNISLDPDSNKLKIEYNGSRTETLEDSKLTNEQREIKEFFQQNPDIKQSLNQKELEKKVAAMEGTNTKDNKGGNGWVVPVVIGMGAVILILIGVIIYKSKKKSY